MKLFLVPILFLLISCSSQIVSNEDFYFSVEDFFIEKTYTYVNQSDSTEKVFWKMKTYITNKDTFFQTTISDSKNGITDETIEFVSKGNSKIVSYTLYDFDSLGNKIKSECIIKDSLLFKSSQEVGELIQWKVEFKNYQTAEMCELSKVRKMVRVDGDKKIFFDQMKFENPRTGKGYRYDVTMIYQKGKGLVSYTLNLPGGKEKKFTLIKSN